MSTRHTVGQFSGHFSHSVLKLSSTLTSYPMIFDAMHSFRLSACRRPQSVADAAENCFHTKSTVVLKFAQKLPLSASTTGAACTTAGSLQGFWTLPDQLTQRRTMSS